MLYTILLILLGQHSPDAAYAAKVKVRWSQAKLIEVR